TPGARARGGAHERAEAGARRLRRHRLRHRRGGAPPARAVVAHRPLAFRGRDPLLPPRGRVPAAGRGPGPSDRRPGARPPALRPAGAAGAWAARAWRGLARLVDRLRRFRPAIVHSYLLGPNLLGSLAARLAGVPVIIAAKRNVDDFEPARLRALNAWGLRLATHVTAVSDRVAESAVALGVPRE